MHAARQPSRSKEGLASLPRVKLAPVSAPDERADPSQEDENREEMTYVSARGGCLSALQLQAHLSWLTDKTGLRRLKDTLQANGAWQQVARIEDLCNMHVSHS